MRYTPRSHPDPPFLAPTQWLGKSMSHPFDIWVPCMLSVISPGGETPQWPSPSRVSLPTSLTQIESLLAPPPHKISPPFSYPLHPSPKSLPVVPTFPSPSVCSVPPPANSCWRKTTFVPSNWTKELPSAVSHMPRRPSPSVPLYPQQPASVASSPSRADTSLMSGLPDWLPPVEQTCHTGGTGGGFDLPPTGLLCCPEGVF